MNFVSKILCAATAILLSAPGAPAQAQQQSPASSRLFGAGLNVVDLARSLSFYAGVLGMKIAARHSNERNSEVVLNFGGEGEAVLVLVQVKGRTQPYAIGDGFGRLIIKVSDIKATIDKVRASAGTLVREPGQTTTTRPAIAFVRDPDGYAIE